MNQLFSSILILSLVFFSSYSYAQPSRIQHQDRLGDSLQLVDLMPDAERIPLDPNYRGGWYLGPNLQTNGFGLQLQWEILRDQDNYQRAYKNKIANALVVYYHLGEVKHAKEISSTKIRNDQYANTSSYRLGKTHRFYTQQLGVAYRKALGAKLDESSIGLSWLTGFHLNIGLSKPYYLNLSGRGEVAYDDEYKNEFVNPGLIDGKGDYFKGFDEIKVKAGLGLKTGLHFNFAQKEKRISALYIYGGLDYYFDPVPMMVENKDLSWMYHFGVAIHFGKYY